MPETAWRALWTVWSKIAKLLSSPELEESLSLWWRKANGMQSKLRFTCSLLHETQAAFAKQSQSLTPEEANLES